jgi:uncharacterized protein (TIGR00369 family)
LIAQTVDKLYAPIRSKRWSAQGRAVPGLTAPKAEPLATKDRDRPDARCQRARAAEAIAGLSGLELLSAMGRGELPPPPVLATLGIEPVDFTKGSVRFALNPQEMHYNPLGTVHGGVLATLLDSATGCAVHSVLPEGTGYTTLDLNARYLRPVTADTGRIVVTGTVLSRGSRTALAEARLTDSRDRLLAHATSTCLLVSTRA